MLISQLACSQNAAGSAANTASEYAAAGKDAAYDAAGAPCCKF